MLLVVEGLSFAVGSEYLLQGGLHDTDSYTRLNRVLHLYSTGDWYDRRFPRSNAPYGEVVHWTRPLDVILMGGGGAAYSIASLCNRAPLVGSGDQSSIAWDGSCGLYLDGEAISGSRAILAVGGAVSAATSLVFIFFPRTT